MLMHEDFMLRYCSVIADLAEECVNCYQRILVTVKGLQLHVPHNSVNPPLFQKNIDKVNVLDT